MILLLLAVWTILGATALIILASHWSEAQIKRISDIKGFILLFLGGPLIWVLIILKWIAS
jgi:hypothetical protein